MKKEKNLVKLKVYLVAIIFSRDMFKCGAGNRSLMKNWLAPTSLYLLVKYPEETVGDS